jgi:hypothetical protein
MKRIVIFVEVMKLLKYKNYTYNSKVLLWGILVLFTTSCVSNRYISEGQHLVENIDIEIDDNTINREELETYLRQKENLKILGLFKFHLAVYNFSSKKKPNGLLKRIGEPPVIYDELLHEKSKQQFQQYLRNKGYYNAIVDDTVRFKRHKAFLSYTITASDPYRIDNLKYTVKDWRVSDLIAQSMDESLLQQGLILDVDVMNRERDRITRTLRDKGFYEFYSDYIHYKVDTLYRNKKADIEVVVEKAQIGANRNEQIHKQYLIESYRIYLGDQRKTNTSAISAIYSDSLMSSKHSFFFTDKLILKRSLISRVLYPRIGSLYSKSDEEKSYNNLYELRQFKYVNIQYREVPEKGDSLTGYLVGHVYLPMQVRQNYSVELQGTNTSGNIGIGGNLNYQHKNLLNGAEILNFSLKGATEWQMGSSQYASYGKPYKMLEFGGEVKLNVPSYSLQWFKELLGTYSIPRIQVSMSYNFQERPVFSRTIANASNAYMWKTDSKRSHIFNPVDLNIVRIFRLDSAFNESIKNLYIKSSYTDHVVSATNYTFLYSSRSNEGRKPYHYWRYNIESAGNILWGVSELFGRPQQMGNDGPDPYYKFLGSRFAQYLKSDLEYRYGFTVDKYNAFAMRGFFGVGLPYGNFKLMPFEKQYYTGGANGIRAWQVRSLGPGSYIGDQTTYPNQSADIKLEGNLEYRFKMVSVFEGAMFLDAGNIWAISNRDNREGAVFHFDSFFQQIAVGTGLGIRFVTSYFVARLDLGVKLRDPSLSIGQRWIPSTRGFNTSDLNLNIGIGYPF